MRIHRRGIDESRTMFDSLSATDDQRRKQGAWIFLVSLTIFFVSCMILYAIYVIHRADPSGPGVQPFYIPTSFLATTIILIAISILLNLAVAAVRREKHIDLLRYLFLACVLAILFFVVQCGGMMWMVLQYSDANSPNWSLYGLTFVLALLHALHVVGGMVALGIVSIRSSRGAYDHERHFPIVFCAMYWHFLDVVWICMLLAFGVAAFVT